MALEALERAVIHTAEIEEEVVKFLHLEGKTPARVIFEAEELEDAERLEFGVLLLSRRDGIARLRHAVDALRTEVQHADH